MCVYYCNSPRHIEKPQTTEVYTVKFTNPCQKQLFLFTFYVAAILLLHECECECKSPIFPLLWAFPTKDQTTHKFAAIFFVSGGFVCAIRIRYCDLCHTTVVWREIYPHKWYYIWTKKIVRLGSHIQTEWMAVAITTDEEKKYESKNTSTQSTKKSGREK